MKTTNILSSLALTLLVSGSAYGQLLNGSFEINNHIDAGSSTNELSKYGNSSGSATNWTASSKESTIRNAAAVTDGDYAQAFNDTLQSDQFFLSVGSYSVSFDAIASLASNGNISYNAGLLNAASSQIGGGSYVEIFDGTASSNSFTLNVVTAGQHSIRFNKTSGGGTSPSMIIDNVKISAVPEPSSTLLLGLGSLALIMRRRK